MSRCRVATTAGIVRDEIPDLDELVANTRTVDPELAKMLEDAGAGRAAWYDGSLAQLKGLVHSRADEARNSATFSDVVDALADAGPEEGAENPPPGAGPGGARSEPGVLPGLQQAVEEQRAAAGREQANRLTEQINEPPESIEFAAGEMERTSPLFRGTEASPQREIFQEPPGKSRLSPADQERVKSLQGAIAQGEMRLRSRVNGIGEKLSPGELDAVRRSVENTRAELVSLQGKSDSTLYSGVDPARVTAAVRLLGRAWQDQVAQPFIDRVLKIGDKYQKGPRGRSRRR